MKTITPSTVRRLAAVICAAAAIAALAGCGGGGGQSSAPTFFLVGAANHSDSFIVPITAATDVARARAIIAAPKAPGPRILVARIARGAYDGGYVNRDITGGRAWSWRVTAFEGFADMTAEILDGTPTYVEDHRDEWIAATGARIGFWSYTVVREVDPAEMR